MYKFIKEFKNESLVYRLGYNSWNNKIYPQIEIFKGRNRLASSYWTYERLFSLFICVSSSNVVSGDVCNIKELFIKLRKYYYIPEYIEAEFENLFILYKLNDFNELGINT